MNQPSGVHVSSTFANGVNTVVITQFLNPTVSTSLDDANGTAVLTATGGATGVTVYTIVNTPDTPVTAADNTVLQSIINTNATSA
jgi:hypothetical protein